MNRHTAGKWIVTGWKIDKIRNQFEMTVTTGENIAGSLEMRENVNLLESVHDLLEALVGLVDDVCERNDMEDPSTNPGIKYAVEAARAAIAKARGEA